MNICLLAFCVGGLCMTFGWVPCGYLPLVPCAGRLLPQRGVVLRVVMVTLNYFLALCLRCVRVVRKHLQ